MLLGLGCMLCGGVVSMVGCLGPGSGATSHATFHSFGCFTHTRASASRHHSRQVPYAVAPHVRICAGGEKQSSSLPRPLKTHFEAVVRGMLDHRSNAFVEAMNGMMQQAKRAARGFRTAANFIAIAYLRLGKLTHLPASPFVAALPKLAGVSTHRL